MIRAVHQSLAPTRQGCTRGLVLLLAGLCGGLISGCRVRDNDRLGLGSHPAPPPAHPDLALDTLKARDIQIVPAALDRSRWASINAPLPVDSTKHFPSYATMATIEHTTRQRGLYPTPISALTLDDRRMHIKVEEFAGVVGLGVLDAVLIPIKVAWVEPPFVVSGASPNRGYERTRSVGWLAEATSTQTVQPPKRIGEPGVVRRVDRAPNPAASPAQPRKHDPSELIPIVKPTPPGPSPETLGTNSETPHP